MYRISKDFHFSASHQLYNLPDNHKCARLHGHNYIVKVILAGETLDKAGFIIDYGDLAPLKDYIETNIDHRHLVHELDKLKPFYHQAIIGKATTAENLARYFFDICLEHFQWPVEAVFISETPGTWASYKKE